VYYRPSACGFAVNGKPLALLDSRFNHALHPSGLRQHSAIGHEPRRTIPDRQGALGTSDFPRGWRRAGETAAFRSRLARSSAGLDRRRPSARKHAAASVSLAHCRLPAPRHRAWRHQESTAIVRARSDGPAAVCGDCFHSRRRSRPRYSRVATGEVSVRLDGRGLNLTDLRA
jgi:hypothetical protein